MLVLASNNLGKIKEFNALFEMLNIELVSQTLFNVPYVEETGLSFIENAILKARHASKFSKKPAIADDSGLIVEVLSDAPGIYSARYSLEKTDLANNQLLLKNMIDVANDKRTAYFKCVLALVRHEHDPCPIIAEGELHGEILTKPKGSGGFGYDPLFWLASYQKTAAELSLEEKNKISHRAIALKRLSVILATTSFK